MQARPVNGSPSAMAEDLALIRAAAREAGRIALTYFRGHEEMDVRMKGGTSPVSAGDLAVDTYLRETLMGARPDYGWLSEESADVSRDRRLTAPRTFVVDPIDGTKAFIDGRDTWCVSIGVVEDGEPLAGVLACPALDVTYWALAGNGAFRDGRRLAVTAHDREPIVAAPKSFMRELEAVFPRGFERYPHIPSLACRIAMIADGTIDATLIKPKSHDWDIAAAALVLREAAGKLVTFSGEPVTLNGETVVKPALMAGSEELLRAMFGVVTADAFG